jgi:hypothetical protein
MELTSEQKMKVERLIENESLTDNLMDDDAKALLEWAQQQIIANRDDTLVRAAVSAANQSGEEGAQALVAHANTFLAQELAAHTADAVRAHDAPAPMRMSASDSAAPASDVPAPTIMSSKDSASPATVRGRKAEEPGALPAIASHAQVPEASGEASEQRLPTARADVRIGAASPLKKPAEKKSRRSAKRPKKK